MAIKEKIMYETSDKRVFETIEEAKSYELEMELAGILGLESKYELISLDKLMKYKDKLIRFFIDKEYMKIEE